MQFIVGKRYRYKGTFPSRRGIAKCIVSRGLLVILLLRGEEITYNTNAHEYWEDVELTKPKLKTTYWK